MKRKLIITTILTGILVIIVGLGIASSDTVFAATDTPADSSASAQMSIDEFARGRDFESLDDEYLAEALGITTDELSTARLAARQAAVAAAVEQGLITQAQADALETGDLRLTIRGHWSGWLAENGIEYDTFLAEALGISVEELEEARLAAVNARIDQAVEDGKISEERASLMKARYTLGNSQNFLDSMRSAYESAIQQAVEDGLITQEQADLLLQNTTGFSLRGFGGLDLFADMRGGHRPHGGGGFPGDSSSSDQSETP